MILCNSQLVIPISLLLHFFQIINCSNGTIAVFAPYFAHVDLVETPKRKFFKLEAEKQ